MISRFIEKRIVLELKPGKVVCLFGARRTGKTVLLNIIKEEITKKNKKVLVVYGQDLTVQEILSSQRTGTLKNFLRGHSHLFIDEAQYIPNIGVNLKLITDTIADMTVFITGSSSFDLKNQIGEPLVGRSIFLSLYPVTQLEFSGQENMLETKNQLELRLIFGSYPEVVTAQTDKEKRKLLENLRDGYLLKDILSLDNLKNSLFIFNLLRQIAFQIGHDVSYAELAQNLNSHPKTVRRYLELLEKAFVIFPLPGFSRNLRKEYTKTPRYYFWDNGVRNILISNFNSLSLRDDTGQLWENYCVSERIKRNKYKDIFANYFYWRTYDRKEIDLVEERGGKLFGFEMKWGQRKTKRPNDFLETYAGSKYQIINQENYLDFIA